MEINKMREHNITQVLKVNDTVKSFFPFEKMGITLKQVYLEDTPDYELDVKTEIEPCMEFIEQGMDKG